MPRLPSVLNSFIIIVITALISSCGGGGGGGGGNPPTPTNEKPIVSINQPDSDQINYLAFSFALSDNENNTCSVSVEYSSNAGSTWNAATIIESTSGLAPGTHVLTWNAKADIASAAKYTDTLLRITANDGKKNSDTDSTPSLFTVQIKNVIFVKPGGSGDISGSSWDNAMFLPSDALAVATAHDEIWVAAGTYLVTHAGSPAETIQLLANVELYGGFDGTETLRFERDWTTNVCILSGDLNSDSSGDAGAGTAANRSDDSYHVVRGAAGSVIDGFTIRYGNADGGALDQRLGGGMNMLNGGTVRNCTIENCLAATTGGGIHISTNEVTLTNCIITNNFSVNGGGLHNTTQHTAINNCTFSFNQATDKGGAIFIENSSGNLSPTLTNCLFHNNQADTGGAIHNDGSMPNIINCTFGKNNADTNGGAIYNGNSSTSTISNSIIAENTLADSDSTVLADEVYNDASTASYTYSLLTYAVSGDGNIAGNPGFVDTILNNNFRLSHSSYGVDAGSNDLNSTVEDVEANARKRGTVIDMGAYESEYAHAVISDLSCADDQYNIIAINYVLSEADGDLCSVHAEYSDDAGATWYTATLLGDTTGLSPGANIKSVGWDARTDLGNAISNQNIYFRMRGHDGFINGPFTLPIDFDIHSNDKTIVYVDADSTGPYNGSSWATAFNKLQSALGFASGDGKNHEIWVAAGTYVPGINQHDKYQLLSGVEIYGGFTGNESARGQRDIDSNQTILSGDINGDSTGNPYNGNAAGRDDDINHIVYGADDSILDGVTITYGYAGPGSNSGGGVYCFGNSPTIRNCTISNNLAYDAGGAVLINNSGNPTFEHCTFTHNFAERLYGGAVYMSNGSAVFTDCTFSYNTCDDATYGRGGGIYAYSNADFTATSCTFSYNAGTSGGAIYIGASSPSINNCTFISNTAANGGGILHHNSSAAITDCTFTSNTAETSGGGIYSNVNSLGSITSCIFTGNIAEALSGGGVCINGSDISVTGCTFTNNNAATGGGGLLVSNSASHVSTSTFNENECGDAGGGLRIYLAHNAVVHSCIITNNTAVNGGGISGNIADFKLSNSVIANNTASNKGGGISNYQASPTVVNCTIINNDAGNYGAGISNEDNSNTGFANCIVYGNTLDSVAASALADELYNDSSTVTQTYSLFAFAATGTGNISGNPLLSPGEPYTPTDVSPVIDVGDNSAALGADLNANNGDGNTVSTDLSMDAEGNTRIIDGPNTGINSAVIDMGAVENQTPDPNIFILAPTANN